MSDSSIQVISALKQIWDEILSIELDKRQVVEPERHNQHSEDPVDKVENAILPTTLGDPYMCGELAVGNNLL